MRITEGTDPEVLTAIKYSAACPFPRNCIVANRVEMTAPSDMPDLNNACYQLTVAVAEPRYLIQSMNRIWLREWCEPLNVRQGLLDLHAVVVSQLEDDTHMGDAQSWQNDYMALRGTMKSKHTL